MNTVDINQFIDVYDAWDTPWWYSPYVYFGVILVGLCFTLFLFYIIWKMYLRGKQLSFEQIALLNLQNLHEKRYQSDEDIRDAYFKLTMVMKIYLSKRYQIALLNKTDQEIVDCIKDLVPITIFATLHELFERSYQIKFSHAAVSEKMLYDDIDFMQSVIYNTVQQEKSSGDA